MRAYFILFTLALSVNAAFLNLTAKSVSVPYHGTLHFDNLIREYTFNATGALSPLVSYTFTSGSLTADNFTCKSDGSCSYRGSFDSNAVLGALKSMTFTAETQGCTVVITVKDNGPQDSVVLGIAVTKPDTSDAADYESVYWVIFIFSVVITFFTF